MLPLDITIDESFPRVHDEYGRSTPPPSSFPFTHALEAKNQDSMGKQASTVVLVIFGVFFSAMPRFVRREL